MSVPNYRSYNYIIYGLLICLLAIIPFACRQKDESRVIIAAAANMQYALKELVADFTSSTGIECDLIISSSGKLTAQITEGAPYDILVAANIKYPEFLESQGLAAHPPKIYAYGKLVLWTTNSEIEPSPQLLLEPQVKKIALANPKTAPYGEASIEFLENQGIIDSVRHKFVFGESIAQTNQFITTGAVSIGFTSLSVVLAQPSEIKGAWQLVPEKDYTPIAQAAVLIKNDFAEKPGASQFYEYLFSPEARKILEEFGYSGDK